MLLVLVGALIVASIETVWSGPRPPYREEIVSKHDQTSVRVMRLADSYWAL